MAVQSRHVKTLAKRVNQRMRALESKGISSPAYRSAQATLEMLGVKGTATGRRFSETGKFQSVAEMKQIEHILNRFLEQKTSTLRGYKSYKKDVIKGAEKHFGPLADLGISEDEYFEIWEELPDEEDARMYGSDEVVRIISEVKKKQGKTTQENAYTTPEIVERIQNARSAKSAARSVGLTTEEFLNSLGDL